DTPRPASYREDIEHAKDIENTSKFYRNIRAARESGWDFSSRWFAHKDDFSTIRTIDILPVDLNSYLYGLENSLGKCLTEISKQQKAEKYLTLAEHRENLIQSRFWCHKEEFFYDINYITSKLSKAISLAGITPLFLNIATNRQ